MAIVVDKAVFESLVGTLIAKYFHLPTPMGLDALEAGVQDYAHFYNHGCLKLVLHGISQRCTSCGAPPSVRNRNRPTSGVSSNTGRLIVPALLAIPLGTLVTACLPVNPTSLQQLSFK